MKIIFFLSLLAFASGCSLPECLNPSSDPPIPIDQMPQFVLLSHDDEINEQTLQAFQDVGLCSEKITFFLMWSKIDCRYVQAFYNAGHEIAMHTVNHKHLTGVPLDQLAYEMLGVRDLVHAKCGIPLEDMVGFRAPYLEVNEHVRKVLYDDKNIKYDSSYNVDKPLAPFTMDSGLVKNSSVASESWPGLWQIPLISFGKGHGVGRYAMDPGRITQAIADPLTIGQFIPASDMFDVLVSSFEKEYVNGSKLPFSINFHTPWLNAPDYATNLGLFLKYTSQFEDVYYITYSELIDWMKNPIPLEDMPQNNRFCTYVSVPPISFWNRYKNETLVTAIVVGPIIILSIGTLLAQIIFIATRKSV